MNSADSKREQILSAVAPVLAARGFEGVRLRDVAKRAGVSIGLLQHHFETRESLLVAAAEFDTTKLVARCNEAIRHQDDPWKRVVALFAEITRDDIILENSAAWTEFCAKAARDEAVRAAIGRAYELWREVLGDAIDEGLRAGKFHLQLDRDDAIDVLLSSLDGGQMALSSGIGAFDGPRLRRLVIATAELVLGVDAVDPQGRQLGALAGAHRDP